MDFIYLLIACAFFALQFIFQKLFEKRTVYDYSVNRYCDDYYYFRRYPSRSTCKSKFYGDVPYEGRILNNDKN